jgi:ribosomal protein L4
LWYLLFYKKVKYKGKICINNIEVDQDKYFDYGTFETKENNFVLENQKIFESLEKLDKELKKSAREYVKHLLVKAKDIEIKETTRQKGNEALNIEGGL